MVTSDVDTKLNFRKNCLLKSKINKDLDIKLTNLKIRDLFDKRVFSEVSKRVNTSNKFNSYYSSSQNRSINTGLNQIKGLNKINVVDNNKVSVFNKKSIINKAVNKLYYSGNTYDTKLEMQSIKNNEINSNFENTSNSQRWKNKKLNKINNKSYIPSEYTNGTYDQFNTSNSVPSIDISNYNFKNGASKHLPSLSTYSNQKETFDSYQNKNILAINKSSSNINISQRSIYFPLQTFHKLSTNLSQNSNTIIKPNNSSKSQIITEYERNYIQNSKQAARLKTSNRIRTFENYSRCKNIVIKV